MANDPQRLHDRPADGNLGHSKTGDTAWVGNDDELLLEAQSDPDGPAFEMLYRRHHSAVRKRACQVLKDAHLASDVTQEVFLDLWRKISAGMIPTNIECCLIQMAHRRAVDLLRKRARYELCEFCPPDLLEAPLPESDNFEKTNVWRETKDCLSKGQYRVVCLRFRRGLALREIAVLEAVPLGTIKSRLHAALNRLKISKNNLNLLGGCLRIYL